MVPGGDFFSALLQIISSGETKPERFPNPYFLTSMNSGLYYGIIQTSTTFSEKIISEKRVGDCLVIT